MSPTIQVVQAYDREAVERYLALTDIGAAVDAENCTRRF
jgi:hypothetical protein